MQLIADIVNAYSEKYSSPEDELLNELDVFTRQYHPEPGMLSGKVQGKFLQMISSMLSPHFVLEVGTMTGYATICLSDGLTSEGELHTIELREKDAMAAKDYLQRAPRASQIFQHIGDAGTILTHLKRPWDLVFLDADKVNYIRYYEMIIPFVRKGGFILADNVLFHGLVLEVPLKGKNAKAIHAFNEYINNDERVECVLLTIRDGLMLIRKK